MCYILYVFIATHILNLTIQILIIKKNLKINRRVVEIKLSGMRGACMEAKIYQNYRATCSQIKCVKRVDKFLKGIILSQRFQEGFIVYSVKKPNLISKHHPTK